MARPRLRMLKPRVRELPPRLRTVNDLKRPTYFYETRVGTFSIESRGDRWHVMFKGDSLGNCARPEQAADDLAGGHTSSPGLGIDTAKLGIPEDLNEWSRGNPPR